MGAAVWGAPYSVVAGRIVPSGGTIKSGVTRSHTLVCDQLRIIVILRSSFGVSVVYVEAYLSIGVDGAAFDGPVGLLEVVCHLQFVGLGDDNVRVEVPWRRQGWEV